MLKELGKIKKWKENFANIWIGEVALINLLKVFDLNINNFSLKLIFKI